MKKLRQSRLDDFGLIDMRRNNFPEANAERAINRIQQAEQQAQQLNQEDEPYWSAADWESWAAQLYEDIEVARKYLPKWFIEAYEA